MQVFVAPRLGSVIRLIGFEDHEYRSQIVEGAGMPGAPNSGEAPPPVVAVGTAGHAEELGELGRRTCAFMWGRLPGEGTGCSAGVSVLEREVLMEIPVQKMGECCVPAKR